MRRDARSFFASATDTGSVFWSVACLTDASRSFIRSTRLVDSATGSGAAISWPSTLASMTWSSASRYSSLYLDGSNASVIASTSCSAILSSAALKSNSSAGRSSSLVERISSGQWRVVSTIVPSNGSSAARASRSRITTLQIAVSSLSSSTWRMR